MLGRVEGRTVIGRRIFLGTAGAILGRAVAARAQRRVYRIGILENAPLNDPEGKRLWTALKDGLRELGYVDDNVRIEHRSSEGRAERLSHLAADLVSRNVDVIVARSIQDVLAVDDITRAIPIVVIGIDDAIPRDVVATPARPGGHVTGLSLVAPDIVGKQFELVRDIVPGLSRVALLSNPANPSHSLVLQQAMLVLPSRSLQIHPHVVRDPAGLEPAFVAISRRRVGAVLVVADEMFLRQRTRIADLATRARLPAMYGVREHVEAGGLVAYGTSLRDTFRRAATYVDKILKGTRPAELPIEAPTRFELAVNLKTAKALGLTIPPSLLARANEVIQ